MCQEALCAPMKEQKSRGLGGTGGITGPLLGCGEFMGLIKGSLGENPKVGKRRGEGDL